MSGPYWGHDPSQGPSGEEENRVAPAALPPGCRARLDPDVLALQRADGSVVARFGCRGLAAEEVERAAWED